MHCAQLLQHFYPLVPHVCILLHHVHILLHHGISCCSIGFEAFIPNFKHLKRSECINEFVYANRHKYKETTVRLICALVPTAGHCPSASARRLSLTGASLAAGRAIARIAGSWPRDRAHCCVERAR